MTCSSSRHRARFRTILLSAVVITGRCVAQPSRPITLESVIAKLQANLDEYEKSIPSFLCDEHMDSIARQFAQRGAAAPNFETIAESVFRLKRDTDPETGIDVLNESREIKVIDGKPANGRDIDAPSMVTGAFSGGLAMVSNDEQACMRYTLEPAKPRRPIVVRFASVAAERPKNCILAEDGSGRVTIDPASMQIERIEILVPHHLVVPRMPGGEPGPQTMTRWQVRVDYKPVVLDSRTFWLPSAVRSLCGGDDTEWSFRATYRNYHKLEVRSRVRVPNNAPSP